MKIKTIFPVMALAFLASCGGQQAALTTGIDLNNLDTTALPGTDFYEYACGGWMKAHPLTAEYSRFGSFDQLAENNNTQLRELIEGVAAQKNEAGSIADKIAQMYNSVMDNAGFSPATVLSWMKHEGKIEVRAKNLTKGKRIKGILRECVCLNLPKESEDEGDDDDLLPDY